MIHKFDETIARIETIIWMPGVIFASAMTDALQDFIDDTSTDTMHESLPPAFRKTWDNADRNDFDDDERIDVLLSACARERVHGLLFKVAVPVTSNHRDDGYTFSWGHYVTRWIYAESIEAMASMAMQFADQQLARDKAKSAKAPA